MTQTTITKRIADLERGDQIPTRRGLAEVVAIRRNTRQAAIEIETTIKGIPAPFIIYEQSGNKLVMIESAGQMPMFPSD